MQALDAFAKELAEQMLGRHCCCYGDAYPAPSCREMVNEVATAIAGAYVSHVAPVDLARSLLKSHCACHEVMADQPSPDALISLDEDVRSTTATIEAAFDARHLAEAHEDAIAADVRGG